MVVYFIRQMKNQNWSNHLKFFEKERNHIKQRKVEHRQTLTNNVHKTKRPIRSFSTYLEYEKQ